MATDKPPGNPSPDQGLPFDETYHVEQARAGSRPSFEALVRHFQRPVYSLCLRYVRDHDAAADLAQRSFIKVMHKLGDLRDAGTFRSWLLRIAANLSLNHLRDRARFVDESEAAEIGQAAEAPAALESQERATALREAVSRLPTKQRMTLELRVFEELSFRDIGAALAVSEGAAKVNFHYAVRGLRKLLRHAAGDLRDQPADRNGDEQS